MNMSSLKRGRARKCEGRPPTKVSRVDALRHAGASWYEVVKSAEARREITEAFKTGVRLGTRFPKTPATARMTRKMLAIARRWRERAGVSHGSWLDALTRSTPDPKKSSRLGSGSGLKKHGASVTEEVPFQPVWLRQGAMDAAERAGARGSYTTFNPAVFLRHAGASRLETMMHEKVRAYYWGRVVSAYVNTVVKRPFFTALCSSVTKCVSSDMFVQIVLEHKSPWDLDWNRVASFFILGVTYVGAFQYRLYNHILKPLNDAWRPRYGLALSTGSVVFIDQAFVQPFVYLPTFLAIKIVSEGGARLVDLPASVFTKWVETAPETMKALWLVWIPAQAINFVVIPKHLTIPWMNAIGLVWNGVLSFMHGTASKRKSMTPAFVKENEVKDEERDEEER